MTLFRAISLFVFFCILYPGTGSFGNEETDTENETLSQTMSPPKHSYIESDYSLQFLGGARNFSTMIRVPDELGLDIDYSIPYTSKSAIGLRKKGLGSITIEVPLLKGENIPLAIDYDWYGEEWGVQTTFSRHKGFVTENNFTPHANEGFVTSESGEEYKRNDIAVTRFSTEIIQVTRPKDYSRGAAFAHSSLQTESGWSPLLMAHLAYHKIEADYPLVPRDRVSFDATGFKGDESYIAAVGGGIGGIAVFRDYYFGSEILMTFGRSIRFPEDRDKYGSAGNVDIKIGAGYNSGQKAFGLNLLTRSSMSESNTYSISQMFYSGYLFFTHQLWTEN